MPKPGRDHSPIVRFRELFGIPLGHQRRLLPALARSASQYRPGAVMSAEVKGARERPCRAFGVRVSGGVNPPGAEVTGRSAAW